MPQYSLLPNPTIGLGFRECLHGTADPKSLTFSLRHTRQLRELTHLEIDCESRHLLRQPKQVNGSVQETWFKFGLQINWPGAGIVGINI